MLASELLPALPPTIAALRAFAGGDGLERELAPAFPDA
jgi:hypothetical protein